MKLTQVGFEQKQFRTQFLQTKPQSGVREGHGRLDRASVMDWFGWILGGVVSESCSAFTVVDIWAMPEDCPPVGLEWINCASLASRCLRYPFAQSGLLGLAGGW